MGVWVWCANIKETRSYGYLPRAAPQTVRPEKGSSSKSRSTDSNQRPVEELLASGRHLTHLTLREFELHNRSRFKPHVLAVKFKGHPQVGVRVMENLSPQQRAQLEVNQVCT